jgi:hypothetical protein
MRPLHSRRPRTTLSEAHEYRINGISRSMQASDYLADPDRVQLVQQVGDQLIEIARQNFPRTNNLEYAILKTHLIIEYALTQYIRYTSCVLVDPESLRFSFSQKLEIAILHGFGNGCPNSVPSVELLNRIRNQVAHRFSIDIELVNELITINSEPLNVRTLTDRERISCIRRWCYFICGMMAGELRATIVTTIRPPANVQTE